MSGPEEVQPLGDAVRAVMDEWVCVRYDQAQRLREVWLQVVPVELAGHCRLEEFSAGVLKVAVDGPGYMHELRLAKREMCSRINSLAPRCAVKDIKTVIA